MSTSTTSEARSLSAASGGGAVIGALDGLIGLGGAEFRLPLLIGLFRFAALEAIILNKAMSLVVVATALPFRAATMPFGEVDANWPIDQPREGVRTEFWCRTGVVGPEPEGAGLSGDGTRGVRSTSGAGGW
jgi:hypothetical protein